VILDLDRFLRQERPLWTELERLLDRFEQNVTERPSVEDATRLHYLYERASADLGRLATFASEPASGAVLNRSWRVPTARSTSSAARRTGSGCCPGFS
jgi:hypothetical protein